jgi:hypothetical protein
MTIKEIQFPTDGKLFALGRNRHTRSSGLQVSSMPASYDNEAGCVRLVPINSNGRASTGCYISLSRDPATLRAIAAELLAVADQTEGSVKASTAT